MKFLILAGLPWILLACITTFAHYPERASQRALVTYTQHIGPIISRKCAQCHNSKSSLPSFSTYKKAYKLRYRIQTRVNNREMPYEGYQDFEADRELINQWVSSGAHK